MVEEHLTNSDHKVSMSLTEEEVILGIGEPFQDPLEALPEEYQRYLDVSQQNFTIAPPVAFREDVKRRLETSDKDFPRLPFKQQEVGSVGLPYEFYFRPGEVTVWAGESGSGKSMLMGQIALSLISQGARVAIASFEMQPDLNICRMLKQSIGTRYNTSFNDKQLEDWYSNISDRLVLFSYQGLANQLTLFNFIMSSTKTFNADVIIIDPLTMCIGDETKFHEVKKFIARIVAYAAKFQVCIILVHHTRKPQTFDIRTYDVRNECVKENVKGSTAITDLAQNVFVMAKNKKKTQRASNSQIDDSEPDILLNLCKQRAGGWEGYIPLWLDRKTLNYCDTNERIPPNIWNPQTVSSISTN